MASSERPTDDLGVRLRSLLADWGTEISSVVMALDYLKKISQEKDVRLAELEAELRKARALIQELERQGEARARPAQSQRGVPQEEVEAMRAELAARKVLVKSLRTDADKSKALEKELAENRQLMMTMKALIDRHSKTIAELRRGAESWERKYKRLAEAGTGAGTATEKPSRDDETFTDSNILSDTGVEQYVNASMEIDGAHTIVIDMTEPLRKARDERLRKYSKQKS
jgi:chromosome segregation ATPase